MKYSIIIPTYNKYLHLQECCDSLIVHGLSGCEVIIVSSGSKDKACEYETKDLFLNPLLIC